MKKITFLLATFILSAFVTNAQNFDNTLTSPGENPFSINEVEEYIPLEGIETFKENSIGILFMPIPLNIDKIKYTLNGSNTETTLDGSDIFNSGIGVAFNADFNNSGWGFGSIAYFAIIGGDDSKAYDIFAAIKYDIPLGDRAETNFELSPLLGLGNLSWIEKTDDKALGNSFYFSAGARVTWRIVNKLFLGADLQTVPLLFNSKNLLGLDGLAEDAKIEYKFIAQLNLSLRYSIF